MTTTTDLPAGYMKDAKGRLVPESMVKDHERLEDQTVRTIIGFAQDLAAQIGRFKGHTFEDVATHLDLVADKYGHRPRGLDGKGNVTLSTYDGTMRVQVRINDQLDFGPGLQVAKDMIDDCLRTWSVDARPELQALVTEAFRTDKTGTVSREAVFRLLRVEIQDPLWQRAMEALRESIRVVGSKTYIRLQHRPSGAQGWATIAIDLASAEVPEGMVTSHLDGAGGESGEVDHG
ncbi:DUF3164 family protein [Caenispirillum bisanense]|uniref:Sulfate transporter n=1 Tax=Caenispirillum bisanense TaxID=414052 RepID=A0A286GYL8_9PROT|nr:DUF3164 family protein [Caenispirillum bisanense]SOE00625.1 Protein of unknown function [Caenispirillum bisanense]